MVLEILDYHGGIMSVSPREAIGNSFDYFWHRFGEVELQKLKELALARHESIPAGVLMGCQTAQMYLLISTGCAEIARLEEVKRLENEKAEIDKKLAKAGAPA